MEDEDIRKVVEDAIAALQGEEPPLDFHIVHERSTAHRLAMHLEPHFPGWNIDCEYDRYGDVKKLLEGVRVCDEQRKTDRIFPDVIVHHRTQHGIGHNLLVIEMKKDAERDRCDFAKLQGMTDLQGAFCYQLGLYINFNQGHFDRTWFKAGEIIE